MSGPRVNNITALFELLDQTHWRGTLHANGTYTPPAADQVWVRKILRGPWNPEKEAGLPVLWICDNGQSREDAGTAANRFKQNVQLVFDLEENFGGATAFAAWLDRIDQLVDELDALDWTTTGLETLLYMDDDPITVIFDEGQARSVWRVNLELTYYRG